MARTFFVLAAFFSFLAVALGAFAAHGLRQRIPPDLLLTFEVAVRYQFYHAFALFIVAFALMKFPEAGFAPSGWLFMAGIFIFSGSLYILSITGIRWLGAITPVGGLCFLAGWLWLAWVGWKTL
jgi:uncharacterized membrane protein YgdD (TMEM256/DUF423 family)